MQSMKKVILLTVILSIFISSIHADRGSVISHGNTEAGSDILQIQQMINQESLLRLTLDKQIQTLRSLVYDLKSKVEQSDSTISNLQSKFQQSDKKISKLQSKLRRSVAKVSDLQSKIEHSESYLKSQIAQSDAAVSEFNSTLDRTIMDLKVNVSSLQGYVRNLNNKRSVYFSARLSSTYRTNGTTDVIKFDSVVTNKGSGYNPLTGTFICPVSGDYLLHYRFTNSDLSKRVLGFMYLNETSFVSAIAHEDHAYITGGGTIIYPLQEGDRVQVKINDGGVNIYGDDYSTFSGILISDD